MLVISPTLHVAITRERTTVVTARSHANPADPDHGITVIAVLVPVDAVAIGVDGDGAGDTDADVTPNAMRCALIST